jgi:hypothetical protein
MKGLPQRRVLVQSLSLLPRVSLWLGGSRAWNLSCFNDTLAVFFCPDICHPLPRNDMIAPFLPSEESPA